MWNHVDSLALWPKHAMGSPMLNRPLHEIRLHRVRNLALMVWMRGWGAAKGRRRRVSQQTCPRLACATQGFLSNGPERSVLPRNRYVVGLALVAPDGVGHFWRLVGGPRRQLFRGVLFGLVCEGWTCASPRHVRFWGKSRSILGGKQADSGGSVHISFEDTFFSQA